MVPGFSNSSNTAHHFIDIHTTLALLCNHMFLHLPQLLLKVIVSIFIPVSLANGMLWQKKKYTLF